MKNTLKAILTLCLLLIAFAASWAITVSVGDGNIVTTVLPIQANSNYSYSQQIYIQDDINQPGWIKSVSFWHQGGVGGYAHSNSWDVYIGHTTKASFDNNNDWVTVENLTKVFTGTVNMPTWNSLGARWVIAIFDTPFYYNNIDNLVVAVDENTSGRANVVGNWSGNSSGPNTGLYVNGNNNINPVSPGTGTRTGTLSLIQFEMDVIADPTSVTATAISASQIKLSWIRNAAQNSVMVAYSSTNDFGTPVCGTNYSVGASISGGGTVIYNGSATSFSQTLLNENTNYYYKLWSVGSLGAQSDAYSTGVTARAKTATVIVNPTNLTATAISSSQINLAWIPNAAQNNVVLAYSSTNTFGTPVFGTIYASGNSIAGGGTVIYNGSNAGFSHISLSGNTSYYYKAWSVGSNGVQAIAYSDGAITSAKTPIEIANPANVMATPYSEAQINLSWTRNSTPDNVMVAWNSSNTFGTPAQGNSYSIDSSIPGGGMVIYNGNGSSFSHAPLDEDTMYYYKLWSVGNDNAQAVYSPGVIASARTLKQPSPAAGTRFVAEWEQAEGIIIAYANGFGLPYSMIADISNRGQVYVLGTFVNQRTATRNLSNNGVNMNNVSYIVRNGINTHWIRDYGPFSIFDANGEMGIVDFRYNRNRSYDNAVNSILDDYFGFNYSYMPLVATGGNVMTDGHGKMISTNLIQTENDGIQNSQVTEYNYTMSQIEDLALQYLGVTEYFMYADPLSNSSIDHIDCHAKLLDVDKVMIARVPVGHANYTALEATVAIWQSKTSSYGTPYRIFRFDQSSANEPYANSFIFNKKIYVPQWNSSPSSYDTAAIAAFQAAMPGYDVQGYYSSTWLSDDALHCRVNTRFDENMLFVHHIPVRSANANGTVSIDADITPTSLVEASGTYVSYRYKNDSNSISTNWVTVPLSLVSGNTWSVDIPAPVMGNSLQYTIRATDSTGRTYDRSLCGRDDPFIVSIEEYHYRSVVTNGNWDALSTWEYSTDLSTWNAASEAPRSGNSSSIIVQNSHTVTLGSSVNADQVTIESSGTLVVPAGITLTVNDGPGTDMLIEGTLTLTGVLAFSTGANATGANSTIEFNGSIPQVAGNGFPASVKNLIINNPLGVTIPDVTVVTGKLTQCSGTITGVSNVDGYYSKTLNHIEFPETGNIISGWSIAMTTPSLHPERIDRQWVISGSYEDNKSVTFYWSEVDDGYFEWGSLEAAVYIDGAQYPVTSTVNIAGIERSITVDFTAFNVSTKGYREGATYTIGRGDGGTLPVELSSFTVALHSYNQVKVQWVTQSETNVNGFRIYRNTQDLLETAQMLSHFIPATNTSQMKVYIATDKEIYEEGTYYYWLENVDLNGESDFHGPIHINVTFADAITPEVPLVQGINNAYPNPFNPIVNITCGMQKGGQTTVQIYNARGQLVKTLFSGTKDKGRFLLQWDGSDQYDLKLPSGVYLIRMDSAGKTSTRKVVLSK